MSMLLSIYIPILNNTTIDLREPQGFYICTCRTHQMLMDCENEWYASPKNIGFCILHPLCIQKICTWLPLGRTENLDTFDPWFVHMNLTSVQPRDHQVQIFSIHVHRGCKIYGGKAEKPEKKWRKTGKRQKNLLKTGKKEVSWKPEKNILSHGKMKKV